MPDWLMLLLAVLATYRLAHMLAQEDGPFDLFARLQERAGGQKTWVGRGLGCVLCVSFWLALPAGMAMAALLPGPRLPAAYWLGVVFFWPSIAGGVLVLHKALS